MAPVMVLLLDGQHIRKEFGNRFRDDLHYESLHDIIRTNYTKKVIVISSDWSSPGDKLPNKIENFLEIE